MNGFLNEIELAAMGFNSIGCNVLLSRRASIYGAHTISIGSNVRIDDFCILSGKIYIGNYVHVAPYTSLCGGKEGIYVDDFANLSRKIEVFAVSDDFSGESMSNPMIPANYKNVLDAAVYIGQHVIIGSSSVVLPGVSIGKGAVLGALSLAKDNLLEWTINAGVPCRFVKERSKNLLSVCDRFKNSSDYSIFSGDS